MDEFLANLAGLLATMTAIAQVLDVVLYPLMNTIESSNHMATIYGTLNEDTTRLSELRNEHEWSKRRNPTKTLSGTYNNWSQKVTRIETEVNEMRLEYETLRQSSHWFFLPKRLHFISQMKSKSSQVNGLCEEGRKLTLVEKEPVPVIKKIPLDIKEFHTLQKPLEEILEFLTTDKFCVGVCGRKGIGKTTIMQNLNNHEEVSNNFGIVIWIKVSSKDSLEQMQQAIVQRLKLNISTSDVDEVADAIREALKEKKYLLLLDDVSEEIKLDCIGIHPNTEKSSKVVITSRLKHVCKLAAQKLIVVGELSATEQCKMFRNVLGVSEVMVGPDFQRFETLIIKFCAGLPLLIKKVGDALKVRDTMDQWNDVLDNLREWVAKGDYDIDELHKLLSFRGESLEGGAGIATCTKCGSHIGVRTPTVSPGVSTGAHTPLEAPVIPPPSVGRGIGIQKPAENDAQRRETSCFDLNIQVPNRIPDIPFQEGSDGDGDDEMARSSPVNPRLSEEPSSSFQPSQSVHGGSQVREPQPPQSPSNQTKVRKETPSEGAGDTTQRKRQRQEQDQLPPES